MVIQTNNRYIYSIRKAIAKTNGGSINVEEMLTELINSNNEQILSKELNKLIKQNKPANILKPIRTSCLNQKK